MRKLIVSLGLFLSIAAAQEVGKGGTIGDLFGDEEENYHSEENRLLKEKLMRTEVAGDVEELFRKVQKRLQKQSEAIAERGNEVVPITTMEKIIANGGRIPEGVAEKVRKRGVLIIRNTIPAEEIHELVGELLKYMYDNGVFPPTKNQTVYEIYWSKAQIKARQHVNMALAQKALLGLWRVASEDKSKVDVDLTKPSMYIDRLRLRPPGDSQFTLPPHVDGGGIERWKDDNYRRVYRHILAGDVDSYDPFEVDDRVVANMNDFGYSNGCTFFRAFQGWLSLGHSGPERGTLRVFPLLKEATAYWMLRPFLPDVAADLFPGAMPAKAFHVSATWHPDLHGGLVAVPDVGPGDSVWWHADLVHSVESRHRGSEHSSVLYIPSGPDCAINRDYARRMRHAFARGKSPPDFPVNDYEEGYRARATLADLSPLGRRMMGFPAAEEEEGVGGHKCARDEL